MTTAQEELLSLIAENVLEFVLEKAKISGDYNNYGDLQNAIVKVEIERRQV